MTITAKALLLSAGIGTRLKPLTDVLPKCLMPVNGRPLIEYWLELLYGAGITEILINLHHHAGLVREYLERSPYSRHVTLVYEDRLLGTGGTLLKNREFFGKGTVILAHADNLTIFDPIDLLRSHADRPAGTCMTMMTFTTSTPETCGMVELDSRGVVKAFHEKVKNPPGNLANAAVYVLEPEVGDFMGSLGKSAIDFSTEVLPNFMNRINTYHNGFYHRDIGTLSSLLQAQMDYPLTVALLRDASGQGNDAWHHLLNKDGKRLGNVLKESLDRALAGTGSSNEGTGTGL